MYVNDLQCMSRLFKASSIRVLFDTQEWPHVSVATKLCIYSTKKNTHSLVNIVNLNYNNILIFFILKVIQK